MVNIEFVFVDIMPLYPYANSTLSSSLALSALLEDRNKVGESSPDFKFRLLNSPPTEPGDSDWVHHWQTKEGDLTLSLATKSDGYLLRFPSLADFVISTDCHQISAWPKPDTDNETLQHLLLDQVLPRLLGHKGLMVLHASAVCIGASAIAFAGETGRGKSTLAASLHAIGLTVICDDGLIVTPDDDRSTARPVYSGLRLLPESMAAVGPDALPSESMANYSNKRRIVMPEQGDSKPVPLAAIYILGPPPLKDDIKDIIINRLSSRDACVELMRNSFRLHLNDRSQVSNLLTRTSAIVSQVPVFSLNYPRNFSYLTDVHTAIIEHNMEQTGSIQK